MPGFARVRVHAVEPAVVGVLCVSAGLRAAGVVRLGWVGLATMLVIFYTCSCVCFYDGGRWGGGGETYGFV